MEPDLSPLDPRAEPERLERILGSAMRRIRAGEAPIAVPAAPDPAVQFGRAARRCLIAASILAAVAAASAEYESRMGLATAHYAVAEALGMPGLLAGWVEGAQAPTPASVLTAMGGY